MLLHLVDGTLEALGEAYRTVRGELAAYDHDLADKPELVALNKADALSPEEIEDKRAELAAAAGKEVFVLSGTAGLGVPEILRRLRAEIAARPGDGGTSEAEPAEATSFEVTEP